MNGRYAWLQESEGDCIAGIRRAGLTLSSMGLPQPPRVFALPDRDSLALGHAAAAVFRVPFAVWPETGSEEPGLIVSYDLDASIQASLTAAQDEEPPLLRSLREHRDGQVLWSHRADWTRDAPIVADLVTFFAEAVVSPWASQLRIRPEDGKAEQGPVDNAPPETIGERLASLAVPREALFDLDSLEAFARIAAALRGEHAAGALRSSGLRQRFRAGGPVPSNRFSY